MITPLNNQDFEKILEENHQPVLADFWAPWCRPCQMMMPIIDQIAQEYADRIKIIKIDIGEHEDLAKKLDVLSIPTFITFVAGQEDQRLIGRQTPEAIKKMIESALNKAHG